MADVEQEKVHIERAIERARDGVSERIDELDTRLRSSLDIQSFASEHAQQLVMGGAVVGFLVGFGFPKVLKRTLQIGVPLAFVFGVRRLRRRFQSGSFAAALQK